MPDDEPSPLAADVEAAIQEEELERAAAGPPGGFPVCPFCKCDPARLSSIPFKQGPVQYMLLYCGQKTCRKIVAAVLISIERPAVVPAAPGRIIKP